METATTAMTTTKARPAGKDGENQLRASIPSRLCAVERLCEEIRGLLHRQHLERLQFEVEMVARECLNNAVTHGNGGLRARRVNFEMRVGRSRICLRITDEGRGFDWRGIRRRSWPGATRPTGRGLVLLRTYARRMRFNREGNQITLWIDKPREGR
jgi:serine/threonine-protein kinase RsbW